MKNLFGSGVLIVFAILASGCPHETPSETPAVVEERRAGKRESSILS